MLLVSMLLVYIPIALKVSQGIPDRYVVKYRGMTDTTIRHACS